MRYVGLEDDRTASRERGGIRDVGAQRAGFLDPQGRETLDELAEEFPVPCEQRLFSRNTVCPLARSSSTEKPWLPMLTMVAGSSPKRNR